MVPTFEDGHVRTPLHPRIAALLVGYIASGYAPSSRLALGAQGRSLRARPLGGDH